MVPKRTLAAMIVAILLTAQAAAEEREPEAATVEAPASAPSRVELGADCTEPIMVSLPDDVLTECEGE